MTAGVQSRKQNQSGLSPVSPRPDDGLIEVPALCQNSTTARQAGVQWFCDFFTRPQPRDHQLLQFPSLGLQDDFSYLEVQALPWSPEPKETQLALTTSQGNGRKSAVTRDAPELQLHFPSHLWLPPKQTRRLGTFLCMHFAAYKPQLL